MGVFCCLQTCNSVVYILVMGLVLGPGLMIISIMDILLSQSMVVLREGQAIIDVLGYNGPPPPFPCPHSDSTLNFVGM